VRSTDFCFSGLSQKGTHLIGAIAFASETVFFAQSYKCESSEKALIFKNFKANFPGLLALSAVADVCALCAVKGQACVAGVGHEGAMSRNFW